MHGPEQFRLIRIHSRSKAAFLCSSSQSCTERPLCEAPGYKTSEPLCSRVGEETGIKWLCNECTRPDRTMGMCHREQGLISGIGLAAAWLRPCRDSSGMENLRLQAEGAGLMLQLLPTAVLRASVMT